MRLRRERFSFHPDCIGTRALLMTALAGKRDEEEGNGSAAGSVQRPTAGGGGGGEEEEDFLGGRQRRGLKTSSELIIMRDFGCVF
jgi:hypothetical protein